MRLKQSDMAGVTLLEIIIAFFILCVAAISASSLISYGHKATRADFRQGEALQLLVDRMNALSLLSFSKFKAALGGSAEVELASTFNGIEFGKAIAIGSNKYSITAKIQYQKIVFENLMQLKFPNKEYLPDDPKTWYFEKKSPSSETFGSMSGDKAYAAVKIIASVRPVEDGKASERGVSAVTFVCNTEE